MDNDQHGGAIMTKTTEERIAELESAMTDTRNRQRQDDDMIKAAAGQLRKAKNAKSLEDIKHVLVTVAGQLDAVGGRGE